MKMKNMLLETAGKVVLVIKWQNTWLNCVPLSYGSDELVSDELDDF